MYNRNASFNNQNISESEDYIPFNTNTRDHPAFQPSTYSSPINFRGNWSNRKPWHHRGNYSNNSSGYGHQSGCSPHSFRDRRNNSRHSFNNSDRKPVDISQYFNPKMLEDPWKELEEEFKLRVQQTSNTAIN